jgi:hypothetical protein
VFIYNNSDFYKSKLDLPFLENFMQIEMFWKKKKNISQTENKNIKINENIGEEKELKNVKTCIYQNKIILINENIDVFEFNPKNHDLFKIKV